MKISASIYSNPSKTLQEIIAELDAYHVDYLHVDCNDELKVFEDIKTVRDFSRTPIDLHIITSNPDAYFDGIIENKVEYVCFQHENLNEPLEIPQQVRSKMGIALMNDTPVEACESYFARGFSFGLLMTTTPGKSGGSFNEDTYQRVLDFKQKFPTKALHVDGGVNDVVAGKLRKLGVDCSISGSYLLKADEVGIALSRLKSDLNSLDFLVSDFMLRLNQLPIIQQQDISLQNVIETISLFKLAFCLVVDNAGTLTGIITDGDLRRELLNNISNLNGIDVMRMINASPLVVSTNCTVTDALQVIKKHKKQVMFLPIVDDKKILQGVVSISQVIKGNL